jgi:hypothetical protein
MVVDVSLRHGHLLAIELPLKVAYCLFVHSVSCLFSITAIFCSSLHSIVGCKVGQDCFLLTTGGGESVGITALSSNPSYSCVFASQHNASLTIQSQFLWSQPDIYAATCGIPERRFLDLDLTLTTIYVAYNQVTIHLSPTHPSPIFLLILPRGLSTSNMQSGQGAVVASYDYPLSFQIPSSYYAVRSLF